MVKRDTELKPIEIVSTLYLDLVFESTASRLAAFNTTIVYLYRTQDSDYTLIIT